MLDKGALHNSAIGKTLIDEVLPTAKPEQRRYK